MGFFPLKKIAALAAGQPVYLRGVRAYNAGHVLAFTEGKNAFYPDYVTADVADGDGTLHVEVGFDAAGEAEYLECACGHAREGRACATSWRCWWRNTTATWWRACRRRRS